MYGNAATNLTFPLVTIAMAIGTLIADGCVAYFSLKLGQKNYDEAARTMGASRFDYWRRVAVPVLAPALLGTFTIQYANAMGAYASAYALTVGNYNLVTIRIGQLVVGDIFFQPNLAAALSVLLIVILAFVVAVYRWLLRRSYHVA